MGVALVTDSTLSEGHRHPTMISHPTKATHAPEEIAQLVALMRTVGPWALIGWRPRGGYATATPSTLRAVEAGLRRKL